MEFNKNDLQHRKAKGEMLGVKDVLSRISQYWYLFLAGVLVCGALAFLYTQYATPAYSINSEITIDDQSSSPGGKALDGGSGMADFSDLLGMPSNAYNEIDILKSKILMTNVVKEMHLNVSLYRKESLNAVELYNEAPFEVDLIEKRDSIKERKFDIDITKNGLIHISNGKEELDKTVKFGQVIPCKQFDLIINKKPGIPNPNGYKLLVQSVDSKVEALTKKYAVDVTDKKSTTLAISLEYPNPKKGEAILQKIMTVYLQDNLQNKIQIADSTLAFIDNRLKIVSGELSGVESKFTEFKQKNNIANADEQAKSLVSNVSNYYQKLNDLQVQQTVLDDISKTINDPDSKRIIPSSLAVQDPVFAAAIGGYNQLLVQKAQLALSYKDSNPVVQNLDAEIENARQSLVKSFNSYKKSLAVSIEALKSQNTLLSNEVKSVPKKEQVFLDYSRQQNLKEELYLYLLKKREETAISKTSTISTARIIDPAKSDYEPFKPNKIVIMLIGIVLGFAIPWGFLYLKEMLNVKILEKEDILKHTDITVIGEIGNNADQKTLVVEKNSRSILSEQFRALRTNLQFVLNNKSSSVIMITSSMASEGKSFVALNLANVLALGNRRVVMIELDLRKPRLASTIGIEPGLGFTNYVISNSIGVADIIKPSGISDDVYIIPSGQIPPNPSELLLSDRLPELIDELKMHFDHIIIDSAPIGLVSDAQLIDKFTDVTLYVVRQEYTYKSQLDILNELVDTGKLRKTYIVMNDIKTRKPGYYGYSYGYSYGVESEHASV